MRTNGIMDEKLELMLEHATVKTSEKETTTTNIATDATTANNIEDTTVARE